MKFSVIYAGLLWGVSSILSFAQVLGPDPEFLGFDDPESWGMKYFAAVTAPSLFGGGNGLKSGQWEAGLEISEVPFLSESERRIGFDGIKVEDLNHVEVVLRPSLTVGLPAGFFASFSYLPPVEFYGIESELISLVIGREIFEISGVSAALHGFWSYGESEGPFTCSHALIDAGHDLFDCTAPSQDRTYLRVYGATLALSTTLGQWGNLKPFLEASYREMNLDFRTNVSLFDGAEQEMRTLKTEGSNWSFTAGAQYPVGSNWAFSMALVYAPLNVLRDTQRGPENDSLVQFRSQVLYRF